MREVSKMLPSGTGIERRAFKRLVLRCPIKFRVDQDIALAKGSLRDLSDSGLGLFTRARLKINTHLQIWIKLSQRIRPLPITGTVVWSRCQRAEVCRAGVHFDEMVFAKIVMALAGKN